jgi:hypothetical protein
MTAEPEQYKIYISIKGDVGDGDYVRSLEPIDDADLAEIMPLIELIKANESRHNFPVDEVRKMYPTIETPVFESFLAYLPLGYGDDEVIHTINSIEILRTTHYRKIL